MAALQPVVNTVAGLRGDLLASEPVPGKHDLQHLCAIHRALFQDIFAWAGQVRIVDTQKMDRILSRRQIFQAGFSLYMAE